VEANPHQVPERGPEEVPGLTTVKIIPTLTREQEGYLAIIRGLAKILDNALPIPGTKLRFGADALLGLIPGIGDVTTASIGVYILQLAAKLGVPPVVMARMVLNLAIDTVLGMIPIVGDVFDVMFQANARNARLVEQAVMNRDATRRASNWLLGGAIAALIAIMLASLVGTYFITMWVVGLIRS
jgi:Domain of unknown function (DUF4112)